MNDEVRLRCDAQRAAFDRIERRATLLVGVAIGALLFVVKEPIDSSWLWLAIAGFLGSAIAAGWIAAVPGRFEELSPRSVVTGLWLYPPDLAAAELANNRLRAFETNVARQALLVRMLQASFALLVAGATMSAFHLATGERTDVVGRQPAITTNTSSP